MLILTRRIGETIIINNNVRVTISGINNNQVRVAIDAPREIPVHREEIQKRIDEEKKGSPFAYPPRLGTALDQDVKKTEPKILYKKRHANVDSLDDLLVS